MAMLRVAMAPSTAFQSAEFIKSSEPTAKAMPLTNLRHRRQPKRHLFDGLAVTEASKPKKHAVLRFMFVAGCWAILAAFAFSFFGQHFFLADTLANFRLHFLIVITICLLLSLVSNHYWLLKLCLAIATGWAAFDIGALWIDATQHAPGKTQVRVMSFNVLAHNTNFKSGVDEIRKHDPDVVAVLEYANQWHDACEYITDQYPHHVRNPRWHGYGIAIFSKLAIEESRTIQLTEQVMDVPAIEATIKVDGKNLRIMAAHIASPINDFRWDLRNRQLDEIAQWVGSNQSPTILVGDFNMAPWSRWHQNLLTESGLRQSRQGFGPQATWPAIAGPLAVPIDHALVSDDVHIHDRFTGSNVGSDHRAIIVDMSISNPPISPYK